VFSLLYLPFSKGKEEHERKIPNEDVEVNYKRSMHRREGRWKNISNGILLRPSKEHVVGGWQVIETSWPPMR
jgi:hypothetical protein